MLLLACALAGKEVNYFSLQAYENERDHIGWHQHREDKCRDARVFITSLGECRSFGVQVFDLNAVASKANRRAGGLESSRMNCTFIPEQRLRLAMRSRPAWVTYQLPCSRITPPLTISVFYIQFQNMRLVVKLFLTWRSLPVRLFLLRFGG